MKHAFTRLRGAAADWMCVGLCLFLGFGSVISGGCHAPRGGPEAPSRFRRIYCWGTLRDEETARRFSEIGVTDIRVNNTNQLELAIKYGMTPYGGTFLPKGPHGQVMSAEEEAYFAHINGTWTLVLVDDCEPCSA